MAENFDSQLEEDKRLIRAGYYRIHKLPLRNEVSDTLTENEMRLYHNQGEVAGKRDKAWSYVGYGLVLLFILGGAFYTLNTSSKSRGHYSSIVTVDVCESVEDRIELFSSELSAVGFVPADLVTRYENNSASCKFFLHGASQGDKYIAFVTVEVDKTQKKQSDDTKSQEATRIAYDPYPVYGWDGNKNFYKISVNAGIDPKESDYDAEYNEILMKLIATLIGTGIADELPENANVNSL